eukprot:113190-Rhodomonas_salina.2
MAQNYPSFGVCDRRPYMPFVAHTTVRKNQQYDRWYNLPNASASDLNPDPWYCVVGIPSTGQLSC